MRAALVRRPSWWSPPIVAAASPLARHSSTNATFCAGRGSSSSSANEGYQQFKQQQGMFHRHSFHEKGSAAPRGDGADANGSDSRTGNSDGPSTSSSSTTQREQDTRVYGSGSATAQQRRQLRQQWERSFSGRLHFEDGMHSRFAAALKSEEEEEAHKQSIAGAAHAELFPCWPEEEEAPLHEFTRLRPSLQLQYIVNRLSSGERRIRYAVDFGGLTMMAQLNLGELMVREADALLRHLGWMNEEVAAKVEEVLAMAAKIKYDFDLD
ncbi:hypothetical protein NESM_000441800 [Novymonas esmeraldas]|uniref:Uncharacterized protein n=1 Tax=Novymonas esmeraldas TaxID=1808958 RepID=A0AAW0END3_9TRYP